jgi:hypothetical protein
MAASFAATDGVGSKSPRTPELAEEMKKLTNRGGNHRK